MDAFGVGVQSDHDVVPQEVDDRRGERPAQDLAHGRRRGERHRLDLGRQGGERPHGSLVLGSRVGCAGAGRTETLEHLVEQPVGRVVGDLHLELAEPSRDPAPRQHRHLVVDHLGEQPVLEIQQLDQPPDRSQPDHGPEGRRPDVRADQIDRLVGRCRRVLAGERELASDEEGAAVLLGRQLGGPALTLSMPKAHPPSRQTEVGRIEVDGLQPLGVMGDRQDVFAETLERRHAERGRCGELHLALGRRRHLARLLGQPLQVRVRLQALHGRHPRPSLGAELPGEHVVRQVDAKDVVQTLLQVAVEDLGDAFDPVVQVARHEVGRADERLRSALLAAEAIDPRVLEVPADQGADADVLRQTGHPGLQAADAADDQVDVGPRLRGLVQGVDHVGVDQAVHLHDDATVRALRPHGGSSRGCVSGG